MVNKACTHRGEGSIWDEKLGHTHGLRGRRWHT
jgi:hypothetical protein